MTQWRDKARAGSGASPNASWAKVLRGHCCNWNALQGYLCSCTPSTFSPHSLGVNSVTYTLASPHRFSAPMPDSQLSDPEVYPTSTGVPLHPGEHLYNCATRVFVPFDDRHVSISCSTGEYLQPFSQLLQAESFRAVPESACSENRRNRVDAFCDYWFHSKVHGGNAPTTVGY